MHPWSKFTPEEYRRRRSGLYGVLAVVGALVIGLFVVQVRLIFPPVNLSAEETQATESFFDSVSTLSERAGEAAGAFQEGLRDERKRLDAEQAVTARVAEQLTAEVESSDATWVVESPEENNALENGQ